MPSSHIRIALVLLAGVVAISFGSILARLAAAAAGEQGVGFSLVISALRMTFASLLLLPAWWAYPRLRLRPGAWGYAALAGLFLALHFATWITSIGLTSIAASTVLVTSTPIWTALLAWWWLKQTPNRLTLLGIGVALGGAAFIGLGGEEGRAVNPALGNFLALCGAVAGALYFMLGREAQRRGFAIGVYAAVAYSVAALALLPLPGLFGGSYGGHPPLAYLWIGLMALLPQLVGHTSFNWAMRQIPPVLVSLVMLLEPVGASLLGYFLLGEVPGLAVFVGGAILLVGVGLAVWGSR